MNNDQTKQKVSAIIHDIYIKCLLKNPFSLPALINALHLTNNASPVIKKFNLIKKVGKYNNGTMYEWIKEPPNEDLINKITFELQEYNKNYLKSKVKPAKTHIQPPALPANIPGPLHAVYDQLMDALKQQNAYMRVLGESVDAIRIKVDNLHSQFNS